MNKILLVLLFLLIKTYDSNAQSVRELNSAEKAAIGKVSTAITEAFNNFDTPDWEKVQDYYSEPEVTIHPVVPIDIDQNFQRDYQMKEQSTSFNKLIMPLINKVNAYMEQKKYDSVQALGKTISALRKFTLYAYVNRQNINIHPGAQNLTPFQLKGCDFAYQSNEDQYSNKTKTYWLLFGNWSKAQWDQENGWLHFRFNHQPNTPYVEN